MLERGGTPVKVARGGGPEGNALVVPVDGGGGPARPDGAAEVVPGGGAAGVLGLGAFGGGDTGGGEGDGEGVGAGWLFAGGGGGGGVLEAAGGGGGAEEAGAGPGRTGACRWRRRCLGLMLSALAAARWRAESSRNERYFITNEGVAATMRRKRRKEMEVK